MIFISIHALALRNYTVRPRMSMDSSKGILPHSLSKFSKWAPIISTRAFDFKQRKNVINSEMLCRICSNNEIIISSKTQKASPCSAAFLIDNEISQEWLCNLSEVVVYRRWQRFSSCFEFFERLNFQKFASKSRNFAVQPFSNPAIV